MMLKWYVVGYFDNRKLRRIDDNLMTDSIDEAKEFAWKLAKDGDFVVVKNTKNGKKATVNTNDLEPDGDVGEYLNSVFSPLDECMNESSYGGAYDIEDDQFFTKEELVEFAMDLCDSLNKQHNAKFDISDLWVDDKDFCIEIEDDELGGYQNKVKLDFRKIRKPSDIQRYKDEFIAKFNEEIEQTKKDLHEDLYGEYGNKIKKIAKEEVEEGNDILWIFEEVIRYAKEEDLKDLWNEKLSKAFEEKQLNEDTEPLRGPEEGAEYGLSTLLNNAIKSEWDAIEIYNQLAVTARAEGFEDIARVVDDIGTEENVHVGQLQVALETLSPNAEAIADGEEEGKDQILE